MISENADLDRVEMNVNTGYKHTFYHYTCPECNGPFNYPAKFDTSVNPFWYHGCPHCGCVLPEGFIK